MRGPLHLLWNTRILGGYLRFRIALCVAVLLAVGGAIIALEIGGVVGILTLSGLILFTLIALAIAFKFR